MKELIYEIKQWVITKIILFLMDGEIVKKFLNKLGDKNADIEANIREIKRLRRDNRQLIDRLEKIEELYDVAIDATPPKYGESWAVICLKGNPEYVRFVKFKRNDIREIQRFLSQFEATGEHIHDVPHGIPKELFLDL